MPPPYVAVLDDEVIVLVALARLLRSAGLEACTFPVGQDFIDSLHRRRPDCVVADLHMPAMDALELMDALATAAPGTPTIIITGDDSPQARREAVERGAHAYFRKPVDAVELLTAIGAATRRSMP